MYFSAKSWFFKINRILARSQNENCSALHLALTVVLPLAVTLWLSRLESINQKVSRRLYCCFVCYQETKHALPLASAVHVCMYVMQHVCRISFSPWVDVTETTQW